MTDVVPEAQHFHFAGLFIHSRSAADHQLLLALGVGSELLMSCCNSTVPALLVQIVNSHRFRDNLHCIWKTFERVRDDSFAAREQAIVVGQDHGEAVTESHVDHFQELLLNLLNARGFRDHVADLSDSQLAALVVAPDETAARLADGSTFMVTATQPLHRVVSDEEEVLVVVREVRFAQSEDGTGV